MPATATDIALASRAAAVAVVADSAVLTRHTTARDSAAETAAPFGWDDEASAVALLTARAALIGTERRRLAIAAADLVALTGGMDITLGTPTVAVVDAELAANGNFLVARIEIDDDRESTAFEVFG